jgi:16S rRNA (guanine527-N7)-methyltransferase
VTERPTTQREREREARAALEAGARRLGLRLTPRQRQRFERYATLLREGKRSVSLTSLVDPVDVAVKHFLDSLSLLPVLPPGPHRLVDVGTGAGFPGVPLVIVRPEIEALLLEATARKADWVAQTLEQLGIAGVGVLAARAEDVAHDPSLRGVFDVAVARAVAPLSVLCELCLPFVRSGGRFIAQKSAAGAEVEVPAAGQALDVLGGRLVEVRPVDLPDLPNRVLVVIEQERPAPATYPRRAGMPAKRPL